MWLSKREGEVFGKIASPGNKELLRNWPGGGSAYLLLVPEI